MATFKIGDRITYLSRTDRLPYGSVGTVVAVAGRGSLTGNWDYYTDGHNGMGKTPMGHGWDVYQKDCEHLRLDPISPVPAELDTLYGKE